MPLQSLSPPPIGIGPWNREPFHSTRISTITDHHFLYFLAVTHDCRIITMPSDWWKRSFWNIIHNDPNVLIQAYPPIHSDKKAKQAITKTDKVFAVQYKLSKRQQLHLFKDRHTRHLYVCRFLRKDGLYFPIPVKVAWWPPFGRALEYWSSSPLRSRL